VAVEPHENEEGYSVNIGAKPRTADEVGELYENQFADFPSDELVTVYGSDKNAIEAMVGSDSWAHFEAPKENGDKDSYEHKGWAIDIQPLIAGMQEDQYQEIMEEINASTLYVVNRAESEGEVGTDLHDFHRELTQEFMPEQEPIIIDVIEEQEDDFEYVDTEPEGEFSKIGSSERGLAEGSEPETKIDYEELVSGNISQSKSRIEDIEDDLGPEDWQALLEAEKRTKDRTTFKPYLEERLEEERSGGFKKDDSL